MFSVTIYNTSRHPLSDTRYARFWSDHSFLQCGECLNDFKDRAWSVLRHQRTVEQWLHRVAADCLKVRAVVLSGQKIRVIRRARHKRKNFSSGRLYCYYTTRLSLHQFFSIQLQVKIDTRNQVLTWN